MTVAESMAKVFSEMNRSLAGSRPVGADGSAAFW